MVCVVVGDAGGAQPLTQPRDAMPGRGGAVASYGLPSPQAAHGVRRATGSAAAPLAMAAGAHVGASAAGRFADPAFGAVGLRTDGVPRGTAPSDGDAGSYVRPYVSPTWSARRPTMSGARSCAIAETPSETPHGRDPKAATTRMHRRNSSEESRRGLRIKACRKLIGDTRACLTTQ
jgi:hypothetical protein